MRNLFIVLLGLLSLNLHAKEYSQAEIEAILQENIKTKSLLAKAGLALDLNKSTLRLLDSNKFMSVCDAIIFSKQEFEALNKQAPKDKETAKRQEDIRDSMKSETQSSSKSFWDSVIY